MTAPWIVLFIALWATVVVLGVLVLGIVRRMTALLENAEAALRSAAEASLGGLPLGAIVPRFRASVAGGATLTEADLDGETTLVLFLDSSCRACDALIAELVSPRGDMADAAVVVVAGDANSVRHLSAVDGITVVVDEQRALARLFDARVVPQAFVIDETRTVVASARTTDWDALRGLVRAGREGGDRKGEIVSVGVGG